MGGTATISEMLLEASSLKWEKRAQNDRAIEAPFRLCVICPLFVIVGVVVAVCFETIRLFRCTFCVPLDTDSGMKRAGRRCRCVWFRFGVLSCFDEAFVRRFFYRRPNACEEAQRQPGQSIINKIT